MTKKKETVAEPVKKTFAKESPKVIKPEVKAGLVIETIRSSEKISDHPIFEKREYINLPSQLEEGCVRVIVLKDYKGMLNDLYVGDIIDLPERRYKSLAFRGLVKLYEGKNNPTKQR